MKKTLLLGLMTALSCATASAAAATKATIVETVNPCAPHEVELSLANVYAVTSLMGSGTKHFSQAGPELTYVHNYDCRNAFTLRGSALFGRHRNAVVDDKGDLRSAGKLDLMLMPGYRYTYAYSPNVSLFAGANVGLIFTDINKQHTYNLNGGGEESDLGFAASAEVGVKYNINFKWDVFAAYQFSGNTARPKVYGHRQNTQFYNGFRIGVGYRF